MQTHQSPTGIIDCSPADIQRFLAHHPPETRLVPGARQLIATLQARGIAVYLISGGFRELCLPIAKALGVPAKHVYANRMNWQVDDESGMPTKLVGFDERELTGHGMGKPRVIEKLRSLYPYETVVMVGDGITDLEAVQMTGAADLFIGTWMALALTYLHHATCRVWRGGHSRCRGPAGRLVCHEVRACMLSSTCIACLSFAELHAALKRYQVAVIGSGSSRKHMQVEHKF